MDKLIQIKLINVPEKSIEIILTPEEFKCIWIALEKYCGRYVEPLDYKMSEELSKKLKELL